MLPVWGEAKTRAVGGGAGSGVARRTSWAGQARGSTGDVTAVAAGVLLAAFAFVAFIAYAIVSAVFQVSTSFKF